MVRRGSMPSAGRSARRGRTLVCAWIDQDDSVEVTPVEAATPGEQSVRGGRCVSADQEVRYHAGARASPTSMAAHTSPAASAAGSPSGNVTPSRSTAPLAVAVSANALVISAHTMSQATRPPRARQSRSASREHSRNLGSAPRTSISTLVSTAVIRRRPARPAGGRSARLSHPAPEGHRTARPPGCVSLLSARRCRLPGARRTRAPDRLGCQGVHGLAWEMTIWPLSDTVLVFRVAIP